MNRNQTKKNLNITKILEYLRQFEKFNSRHLFSSNKIIKGSPVEIYELIADIHDYYCKSYIPSKTKEKKRIQKINSLDFEDENNIYNTNYKITNNEENLRLQMNKNFETKEFNSLKNIKKNINDNYNFKNKVFFHQNKEIESEENSKNRQIFNSNKKSYNKDDTYSQKNQIKDIKNNIQKNKKNDYYSINSFDFNYKIFATEEELKDKM